MLRVRMGSRSGIRQQQYSAAIGTLASSTTIQTVRGKAQSRFAANLRDTAMISDVSQADPSQADAYDPEVSSPFAQMRRLRGRLDIILAVLVVIFAFVLASTPV